MNNSLCEIFDTLRLFKVKQNLNHNFRLHLKNVLNLFDILIVKIVQK